MLEINCYKKPCKELVKPRKSNWALEEGPERTAGSADFESSNYDEADGVLDSLIDEGVAFDPKRESYDFEKLGWITDPEKIASSFGSP